MGIKSQDDNAVRAGAGGEVHAIGVVKLYLSKPDPNQWTDSGIVGGLVTVSSGGSHYLRIVDFHSSNVVFEQEFYSGMEYNSSTGFFHTVELSDCVGGFCFSDVSEAGNFAASVNHLMSSAFPSANSHYTTSAPPANNNYASSVSVSSHNSSTGNTSSMNTSNHSSTTSTPRPATPTTPTPAASGKKKGGFGSGLKEGFGRFKSKFVKDSGPDPSTFAISGPTGFRHDAHIGWDPENGFEIRNIPPAWRKLFQEAGVKKKDLKDKETAEFIMGVVLNATAGGDVNAAIAAVPPPSGGGGGPPPPPPAGGGPPPPPPPPPPPGAPPPPTVVSAGGGGNSRGGLLDQIKQGKELRTVEAGGGLPDIDCMGEESRNNLTNTLANALALRRADMVASDGEGEDEGWDEWDDDV